MLSVSIVGIRLDHPIMNASGILGARREHIRRLASYGLAAIVTKTITSTPREGFEPPIVIELPTGGYLNAVGLANPGKDAIPELVEEAKNLGKPIIVSIGGINENEFLEVASIAEEAGADALELNLSCPHTKGYGIEIGADPSNVYAVVKTVTSSIRIPVIVKLGLSDNVIKSCEKALEAGAKALTLINTIKAMYIDVYSTKPVLTNIYGGLSGPPIHPIAVRIVYDVFRELQPEIIGCGGVHTWRDAAEFILAGAKAIQVGSALNFNAYNVIKSIIEGLEKWLEMLNFKRLDDVVGLSHRV